MDKRREYLAENLKVLLWKSREKYSHRSYPEHIDYVAFLSRMTPERLRNIVQKTVDAEDYEVMTLRRVFSDPSVSETFNKTMLTPVETLEDNDDGKPIKYKSLGERTYQDYSITGLGNIDIPIEDLSLIDSAYLFEDVMNSSQKEIIDENIKYLLLSLGYGENAGFIEKVGINPSTLTRWKEGKTKPDKSAQERIAKYFGLRDKADISQKLMFLDIEPVTLRQKKEKLKSMIDGMGQHYFESLYEVVTHSTSVI